MPGLELGAGGTEMNKTQPTPLGSQIGGEKTHHQLFLKQCDVQRDGEQRVSGDPKGGLPNPVWGALVGFLQVSSEVSCRRSRS